jgi:hypothetical protein
MSLLSQIPKPSFIFDPSQANESQDALTQVRRIVDQSGGGFSRPPADPNFPLVPNKYVQNKAGILEGIIPNVPAVEFDGAFNKGYKAEPSATNYINAFNPSTTQIGSGTVVDITKTVSSELGVECNIINVVKSVGDGNRGLLINTSANLPSSINCNPSFYIRVNSTNALGNFNIRDTDSTGNGTFSVTVSDLPIGEWVRVSQNGAGTQYNTNTRVNPNIWIAASNNSLIYDIDVAIPQMEVGTVATSPIVANTSTATRPADSLVFTGAQDLIGQTSGVMLVDVDLRGDSVLERIFTASSGSSNNLFDIIKNSGNVTGRIRANATTIGQLTIPLSGTKRYKALYSFKDGDFRLALNSSIQKTSTGAVGFTSILNTLNVGSGVGNINILNNTIKSAYLWNNADWITDELAQTLTRL